MPKDAPPPSHAATTLDLDASKSAGPGPLKRGDACLYCRKRRIRCSANKPSCENCVKLKRECIYDTGKPVSRVKQLEEKVAELEGMLKTGVLPSTGAGAGGEGDRGQRGSIGSEEGQNGNGLSQPPPLIHHGSSGQSYDSSESRDNPNGNAQSTAFSLAPGAYETTFNLNGLDALSNNGGFDMNAFPAFGGSVFPSINTGGPPQQNAPPTVEQTFDFSTLDPNFMNLINSFGATSTGPIAMQDNSWQQPQKPAAPSAQTTYGSTGLTPFLETPPSISPPGSNTAPSWQQNSPSSFFPSNSSAPSVGSAGTSSVNYHAYVTDLPDTVATAARSGSLSAPSGEGFGAERAVHAGVPMRKRQVNHAKYFADGQPDLEQCAIQNDHPGAWVPDQPETSLMGGWFDASDVPKVARDHLIDLFFSGMRLVGQEFHVPRFMASLTLPPARRPHPCLLYAMYLTASRISTSPAIRALEPHFHTIAQRQLEESIALADRLFDAVRAGSILAIYYFSLARYHQGFMMTGSAARLAISCGLNQIASSVFRPSTISNDRRADLVALMRQRSYVLPPPADSVELGERIWAFWTIYTVDRCGSIASQWPPSIPDDIVTTPYPKPLHEYELGLVSTADDISVASVFEPSTAPLRPIPNIYSDQAQATLRIQALTILERASKLQYLKPEHGWLEQLRTNSSQSPPMSVFSTPSHVNGGIDEYLLQQGLATNDFDMYVDYEAPDSSDAKVPDATTGWTRTARIRTPRAYEEVRAALMRIEEALPVERRTEWWKWEGKMQEWHFGPYKKDISSLHFMIGCAWMFMYDVYSFNAENTDAVNVARRLTATVKYVSKEGMNADIDVFVAMCWSFISKILIREVKRLQHLGQNSQAIETDVAAILMGLAHFGQRYKVATMQAARATRYNNAPAEDYSFMKDDKLDDEQHLGLTEDEIGGMSYEPTLGGVSG